MYIYFSITGIDISLGEKIAGCGAEYGLLVRFQFENQDACKEVWDVGWALGHNTLTTNGFLCFIHNSEVWQ